ncbi:circularly permuted type 2 ATP-grasp protein [Bacillus sp. 03113]|uniref:circularly permuted type 2 ATP-grasp protein n=1 Tax=Bacillus sp. 03113 TaxID=2578211 RepID=UPI0037BFBBB7
MNTTEKQLFSEYSVSSFYDEMFSPNNEVRKHYEQVHRQLQDMGSEELIKRQQSTEAQMVKQGITFTLYHEQHADPLERTIPFDTIPRILTAEEWSFLEKGLKQRVSALNRFIYDIYHEQNIIHDKIIPRKLIVTNCYFRPEMMNVQVPENTYITLSGIDLIRDDNGEFYVLEDNLRTPSGISYLYKNRQLMSQCLPELLFHNQVRYMDHGLNDLLSGLRSMAQSGKSEPKVVLLTPGRYNSAYYEHCFLAQEMGIELVEGKDLVVIDHKVYMKSFHGLEQVDVIYRRLDDDYLDPLAFLPDSLLGVTGLMNAYRAGNVTITNAPGTGVADDKAIYAYVPDMIRYYLNEEPILKNVPTYILSREDEREYVLNHLSELVVKETSLSGGYGMLIGPQATEEEIALFAENIKQDPNRYIAQPTIKLSTAPSLIGDKIKPRHIDLRAFVIAGKEISVVPGGLTRVALKEGSLVVNSSQGGGSKDTWVLD